MRARRASSIAELDDLTDLAEGQSDRLRRPDESQALHRRCVVVTVPTWRSARRLHYADVLVVADRPVRHTRALRKFADAHGCKLPLDLPGHWKVYRSRVEIEVQYFAGCTSWQLAEERVRCALRILGRDDVRVRTRLVGGDADVEWSGFRGSPTILVDGCDPFAGPSAVGTPACRLYRTPDGLARVPTVTQLAMAIGREEDGR